jgi:hypothetical protein
VGERGEPEAETALRRWPDVDVSVFGVTGSQDTPIEQILRAYGEGSRGDVRGTFEGDERKFLSVILDDVPGTERTCQYETTAERETDELHDLPEKPFDDNALRYDSTPSLFRRRVPDDGDGCR